MLFLYPKSGKEDIIRKVMATIMKGESPLYTMFKSETGYTAVNANGEPVSLSVLGDIYRKEWAFIGDCSHKNMCIGKHYILVADDLLGTFKAMRGF